MNDIDIEPGIYVVAVSGGVDSVVLLDMLANKHKDQTPLRQLIVAHFDHGIRIDSKADRNFVQKLAKVHRLPFVYDEGKLGPKASEDEARKARYKFLKQLKVASGARSIITAHHQDDVVETAIINLLRGTGRRGLSSLGSNSAMLRPLLKYKKSELIKYAKDHDLEWHEDSTNSDTRYLRNYIRHEILPKFSEQEKDQLIAHIDKLSRLNQDIKELLINHLHIQPSLDSLDRKWFKSLPDEVARDILVEWLRAHQVDNIDKKKVAKIANAAKTLDSGKKIDINYKYWLIVTKDKLALQVQER